MKINVDYVAQFRDAAGCAGEIFELSAKAGLQDVVRAVARAHAGRLSELLLDASGALRSSALVFVGDEQVEWGEGVTLHDGATVTLMAPLAGG